MAIVRPACNVPIMHCPALPILASMPVIAGKRCDSMSGSAMRAACLRTHSARKVRLVRA